MNLELEDLQPTQRTAINNLLDSLNKERDNCHAYLGIELDLGRFTVTVDGTEHDPLTDPSTYVTLYTDTFSNEIEIKSIISVHPED